MRFGINTFLFTCPFTNQSVDWFSQFKQWGFDTVEISVEDLSHIDPVFVKDKLAEHGLVCGSVTPCLGPDKDLRGTPEQQRAGIDFMKRVIDQMELLATPTLCGVVYSTVGRCEAVPPDEHAQQWQTVVQNLREVSEYAGERGRIVALEAINRFETDFINTCESSPLLQLVSWGSILVRLFLHWRLVRSKLQLIQSQRHCSPRTRQST